MTDETRTVQEILDTEYADADDDGYSYQQHKDIWNAPDFDTSNVYIGPFYANDPREGPIPAILEPDPELEILLAKVEAIKAGRYQGNTWRSEAEADDPRCGLPVGERPLPLALLAVFTLFGALMGGAFANAGWVAALPAAVILAAVLFYITRFGAREIDSW